MQLLNQSFTVLQYAIDPKVIELSGRTCYKSEDKITNESSSKFCKMLLKTGHESVIEHTLATVKLITSRSVLAELTRHRIASFSVESTRYCTYSNQMQFIVPMSLRNYFSLNTNGTFNLISDHPVAAAFVNHCLYTEEVYKLMKENGADNDTAREVTSEALKTEIVISANAREWRHIFKLRVLGTTGKPNPLIKDLFKPILLEFNNRTPEIFSDLVELLDNKGN